MAEEKEQIELELEKKDSCVCEGKVTDISRQNTSGKRLAGKLFVKTGEKVDFFAFLSQHPTCRFALQRLKKALT